MYISPTNLLHYLLNFHIPHVKSKCESVIITVGCDEASYSIINNYYDAFQSV